MVSTQETLFHSNIVKPHYLPTLWPPHAFPPYFLHRNLLTFPSYLPTQYLPTYPGSYLDDVSEG